VPYDAPNMPETSAFDRALMAPSRPPRPAASLADLECCRNHPGHEGLAPAIEPDLPEGEVIDGRFVIREPVGRSDMATVYRAEDRADGGRSVAIKIPLLRTESDPVLFGRFHREELIGVTLSHPNLLSFIRVSGEKSRPYIAMEYLDGCTLAYILHLTRPLPERDSLRITAVVCGALEYLHGRGYIHRDLKPSNIMICRDCTLRLMDYGLAEELGVQHGLFGSFAPLFGTPEYMAPEQVRNAKNTESTDIYSLGVVLYQMMTGVLPFPAPDPWASAHMRVTGDPVAPRAVNPAISAQAEEIVLHAMRRKPSERYPTMGAFHSEVDAPERVHVTGLSGRLKAPTFRLSLEGTPILSGVLIGVAVLAAAAAIVFLTIHGAGAHHAVRAAGG
jgi:serine/threonine protein kinase